ncbi:MAG: Gfo/Idh/MocA family oxidoreductase [Planctomycetes bacterium]|nr:Gfo/Idh/MocA family oxidoreductase [Planctomycetota bacterium]
MAADEVRFGVVGLGMGASRCGTIVSTPGAKLVAVADLNPERGKKVSEKHKVDWHPEYERLLDRKDIDVIMVMTPSGVHAKMGIQAAQAGKHVITTKPIDVTLEAADALIRECERCRVKLVVDFESRYSADNNRIAEAIAAGKFGKLVLGEARVKWFRAQSYYDDWHGTWALDGGGSLINQSVHWIDVLLWFMGPVDYVSGKIGIHTHRMETEDVGMAWLVFKNGAFGTILGTTTFPDTLPARVEIHGDKGGAATSNNKIDYWKFKDEPPADQQKPYVYHGPKNVIEDMVAVVREGKQPRVDGREGRRSLELVKAIYLSAQKGEIVELPL